MLKTSPDLVYGGWSSAFDDTAGRSRDAFTDAGIDTYLNRENCTGGAVGMSEVYAEVRAVGEIFGISARADELVADMRASIDRTRQQVGDAPDTTVFVYDSGKDAPYTAGGHGIGNQIIELAGGSNIFADVDDDFATVSWEQVIQRKPDVIVLYDYYGTPSVAQKKRFLRNQPELANLARQLHPGRFS